MRALLLTVFLAFISFKTFCQNIQFVTLEYSTAVIPEYAHLKISIKPGKDDTYDLKVESVSLILKIDPVSQKLKAPGKSVDKELTITKGQFQTIVSALLKIKQADIIGGPHPSLLDGSSCSVSYGALGSSVTYHTNTPNHQTQDRNLVDFLNAYKLILRTADIDSDKII